MLSARAWAQSWAESPLSESQTSTSGRRSRLAATGLDLAALDRGAPWGGLTARGRAVIFCGAASAAGQIQIFVMRSQRSRACVKVSASAADGLLDWKKRRRIMNASRRSASATTVEELDQVNGEIKY